MLKKIGLFGKWRMPKLTSPYSMMNFSQANELPTVVIGSGLGGLATSVHLAKLGLPVTLFEKHQIPGGDLLSNFQD
jgi:ribulose 1,5-bisphosphate synthetase/thiazole synthase